MNAARPPISHRAIIALAALIVLACGMAAATYSVFDHTWDEPEHLAAGLALIDTGNYPYDVQHPPLARLAMAIGPYLAGARSQGNPGPYGDEEGRDILYNGGQYELYLTLARIGMLPFLVVLLISTWFWARRLFDDTTAVLATALVVATPVIIGHAAVAALDIPMVGMCMLAFYLLLRWFDSPTLGGAAWFGIASGLASATKLSSIPFIGCVAIVWTLAWWWELRARSTAPRVVYVGHALVALIAAALALLAVYGFSVDRVILSLQNLLGHNSGGHLSYFMGELRRTGWWDFYLVGLAVKTPLPLLASAIAGSAWLLWRALREQRWLLGAAPSAAIVVLVFATAYSHINIGVRHVMLLYPLMAIAAAPWLIFLWRSTGKTMRAAVAILLSCQIASMALAHPDYIAYFNLLAGSHPEKILVDSDLDWGQDMRRLKGELVARKIEHINLVYRGSADLNRENFPATFTALWPNVRATGWIAVFQLAKLTDESHGYDWLNAYTPVARVGKSVDLYYIPPP